MADVVKQTSTLKIDMLFVDGDTRTVTLKNPKANIAQSEITSLQSFLQANNAIIGDKEGATFGSIMKATRITQATTELDINN